MSSSVQIDPMVLSVSILLQGIRDLCLAVHEEKTLQDVHGKRCAVDFVFENEQGEKIGVRAPAGKPVEFVVADAKSKTAQASVDKVRQAYARIKVLDEVKRKGYQHVKEERLPDGSIRMVVQRWR